MEAAQSDDEAVSSDEEDGADEYEGMSPEEVRCRHFGPVSSLFSPIYRLLANASAVPSIAGSSTAHPAAMCRLRTW